jgi:MurNAc alpha-1-phosphate uridylyltransferase
LSFCISDERGSGALETAGGIVNALPMINTEFFLVINADIFTNLDFIQFSERAGKAILNKDAYLGLVENPEHNSTGDFFLNDSGCVLSSSKTAHQGKYTFSGVGLYRKSFFENLPSGSRPLAPLLRTSMQEGRVVGELLAANWVDIGTPQRLAELEQQLARHEGNLHPHI